MNELQYLKAVIKNTDLERFIDEDAKLQLALDSAAQRINQRRGNPKNLEGMVDKFYTTNLIRGAQDYLENLGGSEAIGYSENGVSVTRAEVPSWLAEIPPVVKVYSL